MPYADAVPAAADRPPWERLFEGVAPVRVDRAALEAVAGDRSGLTGRAEAVVRPRETAEVAAVVRLANEHRFAVVPRAGGTGRCGAAVPERGGVVLDVTGLDRILEIDVRERVARVQPGVVLADLQESVRRHGLFFPPDPASAGECCVGGAVATSAGGLRGAKYGTMKHWVLALEVVLPTGDVVRTGARTRKSVVGFDLTSLMIGSEGLLGVVTEATLRLMPAPAAAATVAAWFDDAAAARAAVASALDVPATPAALEFVDERALAAVALARPDLPMPADRGLVLVECDGDVAAVRSEAELYVSCLGAAGAAAVERADDGDAREALWSARRGISPAVTARWPQRFAEDVCVPRARYADMLARLYEIAEAHGLDALGFGHAGDGNIHASVLMERGDEEERVRAARAVEEVFRAALAMGGTLSAEHGIGMTKRPFLHLELEPPALAAQIAIKRALDPRNVMNPGKVFPAGLG